MATVALLMRLHYEIVQQIINRLSKYLSALKVCIFTNVAVGCWMMFFLSEWPGAVEGVSVQPYAISVRHPF